MIWLAPKAAQQFGQQTTCPNGNTKDELVTDADKDEVADQRRESFWQEEVQIKKQNTVVFVEGKIREQRNLCSNN